MGVKGNGAFTNRDKGPGPGDYGYDSAFKSIKGAATFGKHSRIQISINTSKSMAKDGEASKMSKSMMEFPPGPGTYNGDYKTITRNSPK